MKDWFVPPIVIPFVLMRDSRGIRALPSAFLANGITRIPNAAPPTGGRAILPVVGQFDCNESDPLQRLFLYRPRSQPTFMLSDSVVRLGISSLVSSNEWFPFRSEL